MNFSSQFIDEEEGPVPFSRSPAPLNRGQQRWPSDILIEEDIKPRFELSREQRMDECSPGQGRQHGKKDSLKFCRRISKLFLKKFHQSQLREKLESFFAQLVETICEVAGMEVCDTNRLRKLNQKVFEQAWLNFKGTLSYYKNGKISLVTFNEWLALFSVAEFHEFLGGIPDELQDIVSFSKRDELSCETFLQIYRRLLFLLFKVSIQSIIYMGMYDDRNITEEIPNLEHFAVMTLQPSLYRHYNHTKGKFALECCKRCKICMSSALPANYYETLLQARARVASARKLYASLQGSFASISEDDVQTLFTYWANDS